MKAISVLLAALALCLSAAIGVRADDASARIIIFNGVETTVMVARESSAASASGLQNLWITPADLTRATGFEIKPQGVCHEEICFPIPKNRKDALLKKQAGATWFNLAEFARMTNQPFSTDDIHHVWFFGERLQAQNQFVNSLEAPNFTLPDLNGKLHSLSDFRGKKVLLITWASW